MKHYRLSAHIALITLIFIGTFFVLKVRTVNLGLWHIAVLIMVIYATITWFIGLHVDAVLKVSKPVI